MSAGVVSTERLPKPQRDKITQALGKKSTSKSSGSDLYVKEAEKVKPGMLIEERVCAWHSILEKRWRGGLEGGVSMV